MPNAYWTQKHPCSPKTHVFRLAAKIQKCIFLQETLLVFPLVAVGKFGEIYLSYGSSELLVPLKSWKISAIRRKYLNCARWTWEILKVPKSIRTILSPVVKFKLAQTHSKKNIVLSKTTLQFKTCENNDILINVQDRSHGYWPFFYVKMKKKAFKDWDLQYLRVHIFSQHS